MPVPVVDWRKPKYREELFLRYFRWRMTVHDLDHSHYCRALCEPMTPTQKVWFGLLFGMTYRTPQAYAFWWTFPDFDAIDITELHLWNTDNWKRTSYGTDARYNKGYFAKQTECIIAWAEGDLFAKVSSLIVPESSANDNFERVFNEIMSLYKFGRMSAWITCQCLYDVLELPIDFDNVFIRSPKSDTGMKSVWNGYQTMKNRPEMLLGKTYGGLSSSDGIVTSDSLRHASEDVMLWRRKAEEYSGIAVDVFKWESIWCQFKRLFRKESSHEYPGHSSGDVVSRYVYYREHWPEVDWSSFRSALLSQPGLVRGRTYQNDYNKVFGRTGLLLNMHEMFSDMPNAYERLNINPNKDLVPCLFLDHSLPIPSL